VGERKTREGVVVSDAMQKTRVVRIERVYRHPSYESVVRTSKKLRRTTRPTRAGSVTAC